jgi:hypothetical protein
VHLARGISGRHGWVVAGLALVGIAQLAVVPVTSASPTPSASARAAALAAQISAQSAQVHQVDVAYQSALATVRTLKVKTAAAQASVLTSSREVATMRAALQEDAVSAFVDIGAAPSQFLDTLASNPSSYEVGQVYLEATAGQVTDGLARYKAAEANYQDQSAILATQLSSARAAATSLASEDQSLRATLASESATLAQVQQLASQVVADQAPRGAPAPQGLPTQSGLAALAAAPPPVASTTPTLDFEALAQCESGGNYQTNTGNGYYGAYQFSASTWSNLGYSGLPSNASPGTQNQAAEKLQAQSGWGQWPTCAAALGLH